MRTLYLFSYALCGLMLLSAVAVIPASDSQVPADQLGTIQEQATSLPDLDAVAPA